MHMNNDFIRQEMEQAARNVTHRVDETRDRMLRESGHKSTGNAERKTCCCASFISRVKAFFTKKQQQ